MKVIGVTGSIASGKSTVAKIIAKKKYPLFSADKIVLGLYKSSSFISLLTKKFKLESLAFQELSKSKISLDLNYGS